MAVKIVTDSASDLPVELAEDLGITVVPIKVRFETEEFKDGVDLSADELYRRLVEGPIMPTTSQPSVGDFVEVYRRLAEDADAIVSIHVSSKVSGTVNSATQAIAQAEVECGIEVVDTYQASMGVGLIAMAAARAAKQDAEFEEVQSIARRAVERCQTFCLFDTLEYLRKGGRIGRAQALIGTILRIHPSIILTDGEVHPLGRSRTRKKAVALIQETAAGFAPVEAMCVMHNTTPEEADTLAGDLSHLLLQGGTPVIARFGPALGVYVGPGALGVTLLRSE